MNIKKIIINIKNRKIMKKLFMIIALVVMGITTKAQAVSDMAVIPIGVTLNSIARLTVTSGGNIEFVVNTMDQYRNGIEATPATTTTFSVASSVKFDVTLQADSPDLQPTTHTYTAATGTDKSQGGIPVDVIEYIPYADGIKDGTVNLNLAISQKTRLSTTETKIISNHAAGNFQGIQIKWSLATMGGNKGSLTNYVSDRYVVNAFLQLHQ